MFDPYPSAELKEICDKYDELKAEYDRNPTDRLLEISRKIDTMKFEHALQLGFVPTRCDFNHVTQHKFIKRRDLLAPL